MIALKLGYLLGAQNYVWSRNLLASNRAFEKNDPNGSTLVAMDDAAPPSPPRPLLPAGMNYILWQAHVNGEWIDYNEDNSREIEGALNNGEAAVNIKVPRTGGRSGHWEYTIKLKNVNGEIERTGVNIKGGRPFAIRRVGEGGSLWQVRLKHKWQDYDATDTAQLENALLRNETETTLSIRIPGRGPKPITIDLSDPQRMHQKRASDLEEPRQIRRFGHITPGFNLDHYNQMWHNRVEFAEMFRERESLRRMNKFIHKKRDICRWEYLSIDVPENELVDQFLDTVSADFCLDDNVFLVDGRDMEDGSVDSSDPTVYKAQLVWRQSALDVMISHRARNIFTRAPLVGIREAAEVTTDLSCLHNAWLRANRLPRDDPESFLALTQ